jgi:hypothetical protein
MRYVLATVFQHCRVKFVCFFRVQQTRTETFAYKRVMCASSGGSWLQARIESCTGATRYDNPICIDCPPCAEGEYISGPCTAAASSSQYPPTATTTWDSASPLAQPEPEVNMSLWGASPTPLPLLTSSNSAASLISTETSCRACPPCPVGTYLARPCTGRAKGIADQICHPCAICSKVWIPAFALFKSQ